ncbi:tRNA (cytidine/uridine-2'-O-)-methyltransferase TrmJ [Marinobacterium zhoushanense]|uniref:tRNA (cytidine/uridine-2'-O-)-methyltransferase TrmJ n=1 Tax=Marinobacterium zhoushanense TaxID=1679163 RepID=A0ABQ1K8C5_9GAMM|nr:RNA methyltransferase [Marinobacterium zhoushanense]GGB90775.1 tRNA (cytidine/uridine-2'-O-)-methyltransferase TrmJ [Marinobacterium zhoushanense]
MLSNIRIVLVQTFHPGNIGAAARAMKNMGLSQLYLVDPRVFPDPEAESRAAGAKDLLADAVVVNSVEEAIADCQLVIGTSARERSYDLPLLDLETTAGVAVHEAASGQIAILFGRETMGLNNAEMLLCNRHLYIDANPDYPVLNVAQAIQLVCYELRRAVGRTENAPLEPAPYPRQREMVLFYEHLERVLRVTNFIIPQHEGRVMDKLKRYFNRSRPEKSELGMLRGILASVEETVARLTKD